MSSTSRTVLDRPAPPPSYTVSYGELADQVADVWVPAHGGPAPIVLLFHGGFWRHEWDRRHLRPLASALAGLDGRSASSRAEEGYVVATPEYRRTGAPGGGWPGTFDDVRAAVSAVPALVSARTPTDGRVILSGHSAGGQLALWAFASARTAGVVALAPVADLRAAYALDLDDGAVAALLGGAPDEVPDRYETTDPLVRVPAAGRVVVVHGLRDAVVPPDFSARYADAARAAGVEVVLYQPDADHFEVIDPECPVWSLIRQGFRDVTGPTRHVDDAQDSR
jgi:acetyl esterase/lipase